MTRRASVLLFALLTACAAEPQPKLPPPTTAFPPPALARAGEKNEKKAPAFDAPAFRAAIDASVEALLSAQPVLATLEGDHRFDGAWPDITAEGEARRVEDFRLRANGLRALAASAPKTTTDPAAETDRPALDAQLLADMLETDVLEATTIKPLERNPSWVLSLAGLGITRLIAHPFAPRHDQLASVDARLAKLPALLAAARTRLKAPTRAAMENVAIIAPGLAVAFREELVKVDPRELAGDTALGERLTRHAREGAAAIEAYAAELAKTFPAASLQNTPIGAEAWSAYARVREGVTESPAEVRAMGEAELARLEAEVDRLIASTGKHETRAQLFARLEADAPKADKVLDDYRESARSVEAWLRAHPFVTIPWDRAKVEIVPSPPHQRGVSFASMNVPGPLDAVEDARFEVNAPDARTPPDRQSALLRFHAHGAIDLVTLHEALPGHYLQYLHQRKTPSKVRRLIWASTMGEGWAHYTEQATVDLGFTGTDPLRTKAFMLRMALQRAARVVVDVAENDGSMSLDAATAFLGEHAALAPESARIEARRAIVWPANMFSYTYGKLAIMRLRDRVKARDKEKFELVSFHDRLLSIGSIPVRYVGPAAFGLE